MLKLVLNRAIQEYMENFKVMLSYGVLFIFVLMFIFFQQFFVSAGTIFLTYNSLLSIFGLILVLIFLYFLSFFVSLTIYSTKRDVQKMPIDLYWSNLFKDSSIKIFIFYLIIAVIIYSVSIFSLYFGLFSVALLFGFVITTLLMYVPQSIVLDGSTLKESVFESVVFWKNNFLVSLEILVLNSVILFVIIFIEYLLGLFFESGVFVSFILLLIFLVPFNEQMKSYAFILKFNLIKQTEVLGAEVKYKKPEKINATRLREQSKKGKI